MQENFGLVTSRQGCFQLISKFWKLRLGSFCGETVGVFSMTMMLDQCESE